MDGLAPWVHMAGMGRSSTLVALERGRLRRATPHKRSRPRRWAIGANARGWVNGARLRA